MYNVFYLNAYPQRCVGYSLYFKIIKTISYRIDPRNIFLKNYSYLSLCRTVHIIFESESPGKIAQVHLNENSQFEVKLLKSWSLHILRLCKYLEFVCNLIKNFSTNYEN